MKKLLLLMLGSFCFSANAQSHKITLDGTQIALRTSGLETRKEGQPILVFESGFGTPMDHWNLILDEVGKLAPTVVYDRPGVGDSQPDQDMPTVKNVAGKLRKLLQALNAKPPYILVGHSLGGAYVRGFAVYYPQELAGLVIIDPADFTEMIDHHGQYMRDVGMSQVQVDSALAQRRAQPFKANPKMPPSLQEELQVLFDLRRSEWAEFRDKPLPNIPISLITSGRFEPFPDAKPIDEALFQAKTKHRIDRWIQLVTTVPKGRFFYSASAGHFVHRDDPGLIISAIGLVIKDAQLNKAEVGK
ncbi:alpha/beta fold hydrolase [Spirosoma sordidisoli]|uniref:Alpha/beta hydrolase n=1 Tax=Spirosoma sordidisoli TaxID=2502893 RepID=A0A4Q2UCV7_9BACT|nr:alpha/beta hydrolase [Spirosoma sordidisoli]RYC66626.1 alpha/beta hydrolase [Spirosoma sordidisoli]